MIYLHTYDLGKKAKTQSKEILLRNLSLYLNKQVSLKDLHYNKNGKPSINGIFFSVSHSKNKLVQVFSSSEPIGVDVEFINLKRNVLALTKRYFHSSEFQYLNAKTPQDCSVSFYNLWSRKEAVCKAQGGRLWYYLQDSYLDENQQMATTVKGFKLTQIDEVPSFSLVIATLNADEKITIIHE